MYCYDTFSSRRGVKGAKLVAAQEADLRYRKGGSWGKKAKREKEEVCGMLFTNFSLQTA